MSAPWYYQREGRAYGPFSSAEFRRLASEKAIEPTTAVRKGDKGKWVSARHVRGLFAQEQPAVSPATGEEELHQGDAVAGNPSGAPSQDPAEPAPAPANSVQQRSKRWLIAGALAVGLAVLAVAIGLAQFSREGQPVETGAVPAKRDVADSPPSTDVLFEAIAREIAASGRKPGELPENADHRDPSPPDPSALPHAVEQAHEPAGPSENVTVPSVQPAESSIATDTAGTDAKFANNSPAPQVVEPDRPKENAEEVQAEAKFEKTSAEATTDPVEKQPSLEPRLQQLREAFETYREPFAGIRPQMEELNGLRQEISQISKQAAMIQQTLRDKTLIQAKLERERTKWRIKRAMTPELDERIRTLLQEISTINGELRAAISQQETLQQRFNALKPQFDRNCLTTQEAIDRLLPLLDLPGLLAREDHRQAETVLSQWIQEASDYPPHYLARGFALAHLNQHDRALQDFDLAAKFYSPLAGFVSAARGYVLAISGQMRASADAFASAEQIQPKSAVVSLLRGYAYLARKDFSYAERQFLQAVRYNENRPEAHEALAYVMATKKQVESGDRKKAVEHAEAACNLTKWNNWSSLDVLAMAYAAAGEFQLAGSRAKQALHLAPKSQRGAIEERLELYAGSKPYSIR